MDDPPAVVVRRSGPLGGAERANIVDRITAAGNGIQLEQPAGVRTVKEQRDAIARAVATFYADLAQFRASAPRAVRAAFRTPG